MKPSDEDRREVNDFLAGSGATIFGIIVIVFVVVVVAQIVASWF